MQSDVLHGSPWCKLPLHRSNDDWEPQAFLQVMQNTASRLPSLDRLAVFDAAARHRSFTLAAAERFITQSAVSRQVAALEEELGVPLFRRRHRALELTDDGRRLAEAVARALATVREALSQIHAPGRREVLSVTTTPGLASLWLIPRLADFVARHPGIDVRIDASYAPRPLAADGFDLAIRYTALEGAEGAALFGESIVPVCSPRLLRAGAPLKTAADLARHTLLQLDSMPAKGPPLEWQNWFLAQGLEPVTPVATLSFTHYDAAVAAAVAGQGVVLGRRPLIDALLRRRELVAPVRGAKASAQGYVVVLEPAAARKPAAQALVAWLLEQARAA
jgi:DNA-binding transcriptional LysR family regulator